MGTPCWCLQKYLCWCFVNGGRARGRSLALAVSLLFLLLPSLSCARSACAALRALGSVGSSVSSFLAARSARAPRLLPAPLRYAGSLRRARLLRSLLRVCARARIAHTTRVQRAHSARWRACNIGIAKIRQIVTLTT